MMTIYASLNPNKLTKTQPGEKRYSVQFWRNGYWYRTYNAYSAKEAKGKCREEYPDAVIHRTKRGIKGY